MFEIIEWPEELAPSRSPIAPDAFWLTHEKLPRNLPKVAAEREGSRN
jgi:hypothetical protein